MQQVRLENWDWIADDDRPTSKAKGASRRYAFHDFTDRIKLNERTKKKGPAPKNKKEVLEKYTVIFVGSIQQDVKVRGKLKHWEVIKRFPTAERFNYTQK